MIPERDVIESVTMQFLPVYAQERLSPIIIQDLKAEVLRDLVFDHIIIRLRGYVLGQPREPYECGVWYSSWWQHTKAIHFPTLSKWIRRPPRRKMVEVTPWETYPFFNQQLPEDQFGKMVAQFLVRGYNA